MSDVLAREKGTVRGVFGVFPRDHVGTVGDLFGMWHHTLAEAERHLLRIRDHVSSDFIVLRKTDYDQRINEQQALGLTFKTGHDRLMDEFDQWLKDNHLVRGAAAAVSIGLSDQEFKSGIKHGFFQQQSMPDHDNLIGYAADLSFTVEQRDQLMNERALNAHQVVEQLGISLKEFNEIKRRFDVTHSSELLGRTVPNDSGTALLYSRADIQNLGPAAREVKANRTKPSGSNKAHE